MRQKLGRRSVHTMELVKRRCKDNIDTDRPASRPPVRIRSQTNDVGNSSHNSAQRSVTILHDPRCRMTEKASFECIYLQFKASTWCERSCSLELLWQTVPIRIPTVLEPVPGWRGLGPMKWPCFPRETGPNEISKSLGTTGHVR